MATVLDNRLDRDDSPTLADLARKFGAIPSWRILTDPAPGTATEEDVERLSARNNRHCELIDGVLVEKTMGFAESILAVAISSVLSRFVKAKRLGIVAGEGGSLKFAPGLVYIPDVSYVSYASMPDGKRPRAAVPTLIPDLAVEVISKSNTPKELRSKLHAFFKHGVKLVWYVDPLRRTVDVYTAPNTRTTLGERETLTGGTVLPGFKLKLRELFSELDDDPASSRR